MSEIELAQYMLALLSEADAQFEFWLTVTSGVLVASFVAGDALSKRLRVLLALFYVWASAVFYTRYGAVSTYLNGYEELAASYGAAVLAPTSMAAGVLRSSLWVVGTAVAVWVVLRGNRGHAKSAEPHPVATS